MRQQGHDHWSWHDFLQHLESLIESPWLAAAFGSTDKAARRKARLKIPSEMPGWSVYNSDGAARRQEDGSFLSSYGVVVQRDNRVLAEKAVFIGDCTNNEAEYEGLLAALQHACGHPAELVLFRVDSMLLARHLQGAWGCHTIRLEPLYESAHTLLRNLRSQPVVQEARVEHVYREFNALADSLANLAIEGRTGNSCPQQIVNSCW